jgi:hypothetical protein
VQVNAATFRFGTIASSVSAAVGESNIQAASATVSSLGAKTRGAVSSTVSFLEEKGVVSGAQGLVASAGATAKSVFAIAQSGVRCNLLYFVLFLSVMCISGKVCGVVLQAFRIVRTFRTQLIPILFTLRQVSEFSSVCEHSKSCLPAS